MNAPRKSKLRQAIESLPVHAIDEPDGAGWGVSREEVLRVVDARLAVPVNVRQAAYDALPKDADDDLYRVADFIVAAIIAALVESA